MYGWRMYARKRSRCRKQTNLTVQKQTLAHYWLRAAVPDLSQPLIGTPTPAAACAASMQKAWQKQPRQHAPFKLHLVASFRIKRRRRIDVWRCAVTSSATQASVRAWADAAKQRQLTQRTGILHAQARSSTCRSTQCQKGTQIAINAVAGRCKSPSQQ